MSSGVHDAGLHLNTHLGAVSFLYINIPRQRRVHRWITATVHTESSGCTCRAKGQLSFGGASARSALHDARLISPHFLRSAASRRLISTNSTRLASQERQLAGPQPPDASQQACWGGCACTRGAIPSMGCSRWHAASTAAAGHTADCPKYESGTTAAPTAPAVWADGSFNGTVWQRWQPNDRFVPRTCVFITPAMLQKYDLCTAETRIRGFVPVQTCVGEDCRFSFRGIVHT